MRFDSIETDNFGFRFQPGGISSAHWPNIDDEFQAAEAKPVDSGENLVVLIPDDAGVFYRVERASNRPACTNVVQSYVDLAHQGGRGEEAADAILQQRFKPAWSGARP